MTTDPTSGQPREDPPPSSQGYPSYPTEPQPGYPQYPAGQQPPGSGPGSPPPSDRNTVSIVGIVLGVLGAIVGPLFGVIGIVLSVFAMRRGERMWRTALIVSIIGTVIGSILVAAYLSNR
jgi:hypothetical protein